MSSGAARWSRTRPACAAPPRGRADRQLDAIAIAIAIKADPPAVAPGATTKLTLTFMATTRQPRSIALEMCDGEPRIDAEAWRGSERADLAPSDIFG